MTILRKTAATALAVAILGSGLSATTASAAPLIRATPAVADTQADVVKVGFHKKHFKHGWGHNNYYNSGYHGYGYGYGHCFWTKKRFWDNYYGGYYYKKVRICR